MEETMAEYKVEDRRNFDGDGNLKDQAEIPQPEQEAIQPKQPEGPSIAQKILLGDIIGRFLAVDLIPKKYVVGEKSGLIEMNETLRVSDHDTPWCFVNNSSDRACSWSLDIGMIYGFVPKKCRNCWKVVVYPNNVKELFMLKKLMEIMSDKDPYCLCKCGIEPRPEVERNYGGYFYTNSIEQGLFRLKQVRALVAKRINPDIRVILKRGCTEFERAFGNSATWDEQFDNDHFNTIEEHLEKNSSPSVRTQYGKQQKLIQDHVLAKWIRFAADRGDKSVKELNDGENLYPDYQTYEEEMMVFEGDKDGKQKTSDS